MKTVVVFFGGKSTEHDVSIVTALASVITPLRLTKQCKVVPVYIAKNGAWYSDERLEDISLYSSGKIDGLLKKLEPVSILLDDGLVLSRKGRFGKRQDVRIDVAFPATHGTYGEDGSLMGMLRMAGIPFVGCDMEASVIAMNKLLAHEVVEAAGVESHSYVGLTKYEFESNKPVALSKLAHLSYPLFVKPVHLGSSIGITKVTSETNLSEALEVAFCYDTVAIVEEAIPNLIEVTVPMMGPTENPTIALVEKPLVSGKVFDFDAKYMSGGKVGKKMGGKMKGSQGYSELPAKLPEGLYEICEDVARRVYGAVGCAGLARIDLLIDGGANKVYFNEINPLPGGLYDHNWRAAGVSSVELVQKLVDDAEARFAEKSKITTNFTTSFLKQF